VLRDAKGRVERSSFIWQGLGGKVLEGPGGIPPARTPGIQQFGEKKEVQKNEREDRTRQKTCMKETRQGGSETHGLICWGGGLVLPAILR